jgi:hypothetical protein
MILLPNDYWEIKETKNKGRGIFAKKEISKGTIIGDYLGRIVHPKDAIVDEENFYLMYYHDKAAIAPDLKQPGVHLLNHSCVPNAWLYTYSGHTLAFALKDIARKTEITIPYLLSPKDEFCNPCPHVCECNDAHCTKNMHLTKDEYDKWRKLNEKWAKKTKRERIRYGKELPHLSNYPKTIPNEYIEEVNLCYNAL